MAGLSTFLGEAGGIARQMFLWGLLESVVEAVVAPFIRALEYDTNTKDPNAVLSPADLAQLVVRHVKQATEVVTTAKKAGITPARFTDLLHIAAGPPGLETVLQMHRRGIIQWGEPGPTKANAANAIATARLYTYWSDAIRKMNISPIPAAEMVDAMVERQTTSGTRGIIETMAGGGTVTGLDPNATTFYEAMWANGFTPAQADLMYHTRGNPPAPTQLIDLFRRGCIGWTGTGPTATTVQQGIYEGATKDKWEPLYKGLVEELPSAYYILTFLKSGAMTEDVAVGLLKDYGYSATVIAGIIGYAHATKVATYTKLTESIITRLYQEQVVTRQEAQQMLEGIGYVAASATFVLTAIDADTSFKQTTAAIDRVRSLFLARKITATVAKSAVSVYGLTGDAAANAVAIWTRERSLTVKLLTEAQIVDAWEYGIMDGPTALVELTNIGYTPYDAWVVLSVKNKGPLPTAPAKSDSGIGTAT